MAFAFDPKAALAAHRNREVGLATTATVATETGGPGAVVATVATVATGRAPERNGDVATGAGALGFSEREPRKPSAPGGPATVATTATGAAGLSQLSHDACAVAASHRDFEAPVAAALDIPDPARLAALLAEHGPITQGVAGAALGWGGTQAWQAEAALWERRFIEYDRIGRAAIAAAWEAFERANDPHDPKAWR